MIRFVVGPAGEAVPTSSASCPDAGYGSRRPERRSEAVKRKVFGRGFKRDVRVGADLPAATERLLEQRALDALAIAGKAGQVIAGFAKVEAAIGRADLVALIHAADGGRMEGASSTRPYSEKTPKSRGKSRSSTGLTGAQLDLALNRPNVVHAALLAGPVSDTFLARAKRLERFRTGDSPDLVSAHAPTDGARGQNT